MSVFAETLKNARTALGYRNAREFFSWLQSNGASFNYSYYMRLEQGGLPSEKVVQEIASALRDSWGDQLVLTYCQSLFPKFGYLFPERKPSYKVKTPTSVSPPSAKQKELTLRQVAAIASSEACYQIFLLATLSRGPVEEQDLLHWFSRRTLSSAIHELSEAEIVRVSSGKIEAMAVEARFPDAYNEDIKEAYAKFDRWDERFGEHFGLEFVLNKMLIRRVSGRYISIIRKQLETLFELVKSSDEVDTRYNESVLQMKVVLRQGKLPG
jgi:hypothetical protein